MKRIHLKGTEAAILEKLQSMPGPDGQPLYPNYPEGYEQFPEGKRYIITGLTPEMSTPTDPEQAPEPTGQHFCHLIVPAEFDETHFDPLRQ